MRTITYNAGAYLVEELQKAGIVAHFLHDGGDIILFRMWTGQRVSIHLIESSIELYEIKNILAANNEDDIYTLFVLWGDRLLPGDGQHYFTEDWLAAFFSLYGDRVYAYDIYGNEIFIFPVYFDGYGFHRRVRYGTSINVAHIGCQLISTTGYNFVGSWRIAGFQYQQSQNHQPVSTVSALTTYYQILGVDEDANRDLVRKAYRLLARRYHPDLNKSSNATARMQQINEAYNHIMELLDEEE